MAVSESPGESSGQMMSHRSDHLHFLRYTHRVSLPKLGLAVMTLPGDCAGLENELRVLLNLSAVPGRFREGGGNT